MPGRKRAAVSEERHTIRLVQQVPAGTPGAYVDPIMSASWIASRKGLNGKGGFVSIEHDPILNDATEFPLILPPQGADGVDAGNRFYSFAGSIDPSNPTGPRAAYFPGDEWIEVYRGNDELIACGTPIDADAGVNPPQVQLQCRDVLHPLKKTRETAAGFWCNAPRDVFEHYTRLWQTVVSDDFTDTTQWPSSVPHAGNTGTTPDGRWAYQNVDNAGGASFVRFDQGALVGAADSWIAGTTTVTDGGAGDHSCWRAEMRAAGIFTQYTSPFIVLWMVDSTLGNPLAANNGVSLAISPVSANCALQTFLGGVVTTWPLNLSGLLNDSGQLLPPYVLAIEARERWCYAYLNGQLIGVAPRPAYAAPVALRPVISDQLLAVGPTGYMDIDFCVVRKTTNPLNGGTPGDYFLPSPPAPGGLTGEYFDLAAPQAQWGAPAAKASTFAPGLSTLGQARTDQIDALPTGAAPAWQMPGLVGAFAVRWTGAIYLSLATTDVTFQLPTAGSDMFRIWVGKTRAGEQILTNWTGDTVVTTSAGMRSLFGSVSGWYPVVIEYYWAPTGGSPGAWTGNSNPNWTYNIGAGYVTPATTVLAPLGVHRTKANAGDSHYDTLKTLCEDYAFQFKTQPMQLESGYFPGAVVPRARVGRDTDYVLTIDEAIDPQLLVNAEDVANALMAAAQGLGGSSSGTLSLEAFDFAGLLQHPFVSQEYENLPSTTVLAQLSLALLSLLAYRTSAFEDVQVSTPGQRQKQDTFPLTGTLAEFDWQPGDGLRVQFPAIYVNDILPRQILSLKRMLYPDGVGTNQASFRPRNRTPEQTLRKFIRQVYGDRRTFQGQIVNSPGTRAVAPAYSEAVLPTDLTLVRQAQLVVLSKSDATTTYDIAVNGTIVVAAGVKFTGVYNVGPYVARNNSTEPRMVVQLLNPSAPGCQVSYQVRLRELIPSI